MARPDDKPVASVRPIQSTPIPMMPRQVGMGMAGSSSTGSLPVNFLQKAGVYVQRIVTTTGNVLFLNAYIFESTGQPLKCYILNNFTHSTSQ